MTLALVARLPRAGRYAALTAAGATGVAYYVGSLFGLALRLPPSTPSVLWPPNAILTAALLLTPTRWWPLCLAAALPAHLAVQLQTDWPVALVLSLFLTNCTEALVGAGAVRTFIGRPLRLDTLGGLAAFFIAVVIAGPLVSNFADAAVVHWFNGEAFWDVWRRRLPSNMLSELTIVPAVMAIAPVLTGRDRRWSLARLAEGAAVGAGLVASGLLTFSDVPQVAPLHIVSAEVPLALHLPFLLWAAVRFGPGAAGLASFVTTEFTVYAAVHGHGPFHSFALGAAVFPLQLSLTLVTLTLLSVATLNAERRQALRQLTERLRIEQLIARMSAALVKMPSDRMSATFDAWMARLLRAFDLSAVVLLRTKDSSLTEVVSGWTSRTLRHASPNVAHGYPWAAGQVVSGKTVIVDGANPLPSEAVIDRESLEDLDLGAVCVMPMGVGGGVIGSLVCARQSSEPWSERQLAHFRLIGNVLTDALARKQAEDALRASEFVKSALLDSLPMSVAVVDAGGQIRAVNRSWAALAADGNPGSPPVGEHLIEHHRALGEAGHTYFGEIARGVQSVLDGRSQRFATDLPPHGSEGRWWSMLAVRLNPESGGAVVINSDVTDWRRAELDAQQHRSQLAHVARVSMLGELTTSLAHQLNQPLAAIMANASAARMLLDPSMPSASTLQEILSDITDDDRRASEVIQRLREMLRKRDLDMTDVDLAAAVDDVARLVHSDAVIRRIRITAQLEHRPLTVRGDRVQLQQVLLNLLVNALEAIGDDRHERQVTMAGRQNGDNMIVVSVEDSGNGLAAATEPNIFDPFFTTKQSGLGMGLSIARSIVEAHGGSITARNRASGGALFEVALPAVSAAGPKAGAAGSGANEQAAPSRLL